MQNFYLTCNHGLSWMTEQLVYWKLDNIAPQSRATYKCSYLLTSCVFSSISQIYVASTQILPHIFANSHKISSRVFHSVMSLKLAFVLLRRPWRLNAIFVLFRDTVTICHCLCDYLYASVSAVDNCRVFLRRRRRRRRVLVAQWHRSVHTHTCSSRRIYCRCCHRSQFAFQLPYSWIAPASSPDQLLHSALTTDTADDGSTGHWTMSPLHWEWACTTRGMGHVLQ